MFTAAARCLKLSIPDQWTKRTQSGAAGSAPNAAEDSPHTKHSGNRQQFDPVKLKNGIIKSCEKRPVSAEKIDRLVEDIQKQLYNTLKSEISSKEIGELVMDGLKKIDEVAYIRFASVYRQFKDSNTFFEEMKKIFDEKEHKES